MQMGFGFGALDDIRWVRSQLDTHFGSPGAIYRRSPVGQLVKSSISSRTQDSVSLAAYGRLIETFPSWAELAAASADQVESAIADVTFPDVKARHLLDALRMIAADHPDFDLGFLADMNIAHAKAWLEHLPGVGPKVAASALNFSTLAMPAFVVDTHILRILRRYGFIRGKADIAVAYDTIMEMAPWEADDLAELHMLMKRLGQTICRADHPDCRICPLRRKCKVASQVRSSKSSI
ncbi:endonuclease III domain-containing protein [Rhizorhabdus dicambivorans]|uniref:Endonuclease n=1 Tax=Rhizorhabdus dicambivorans TaxID=1850238 RepID=A0A2A4FXF7_9SPHN|nr:endonuclease [Rhizorhabdus dicambivorans]ATE65274.1 endonuclease [Rhizorhabdus dicambivorans]PCE42401.1 endonuclease [Rhizorhabdus dicambivorans]